MRYCGIDPGLLGGIAFVDWDGKRMGSFSFLKMPRYSVKLGERGKIHNFVDVIMLHEHVSSQSPDVVLVEQQRGYPNQSSSAVHTSGTNYGIILSLRLLFPKIHIVMPDQWKHRLGLSADKTEAIDLCRKLFGRGAPNRDGPAEALLIAHYGILEELE